MEKENIKKESGNIEDLLSLYMSELKPRLSEKEMQELLEKIKFGDSNLELKNQFIEYNLALVIPIALQNIGKGVPLLDLIQEGNLGVIKALLKFDIEKGVKFSTYATYWIRSYIQTALEKQARNIKLTKAIEMELSKYRKIEYLLTQELKRKPTQEEIARKMKCSIGRVKELEFYKIDTIRLDGETKITENQSEELIGAPQLSLKNCIDIDQDLPENIIIKKSMRKQVRKLLQKTNLTKKERITILLRYGFITDPKSLAEIGSYLNVTKEAIRQAEERALRKLRENNQLDPLAIYLDNEQQAIEKLKHFRKDYQENKKYVKSTKR